MVKGVKQKYPRIATCKLSQLYKSIIDAHSIIENGDLV